jgi:hypothetical protein
VATVAPGAVRVAAAAHPAAEPRVVVTSADAAAGVPRHPPLTDGSAATSGAATAGPSPAPPGAAAVIFASLLAAFAALLFARIDAPPAWRSVRLVSLVERPG